MTPESKYGLEDQAPEPLQFFNYHEYLVKSFKPITNVPDPEKTLSSSTHTLSPSNHVPSISRHPSSADDIAEITGPSSSGENIPGQSATAGPLVVNHFVNLHAPPHSLRYKTTRLVRIARVFHTIKYPDLIPQFSNEFPGKEPARIDNGSDTFKLEGVYDCSGFGTNSLTPLVPHLLSYEHFKQVIDDINDILFAAHNPFNWVKGLENILNIVLANLFHEVVASHSKRVLSKLDAYISQFNESRDNEHVRIVSPRLNGYLSVCIFTRLLL